jgi:hypothetical protein
MILRLIKSISYRLSRFYFVIINFIIRELNDNLSLIYISFFNDYANKNTPNKKVPIILICRNKNHLPTVAESGESMEKFHLEDSIKKRKITLINFYWDQRRNLFLHSIYFCKTIMFCKPDLVVLSSYSCSNKRRFSQPAIKTIEKLKPKSNSKFVAVWWDTCGEGFAENNIVPFKGIIDLHAVNDNPKMDFNTNCLSCHEKTKVICESPSYDPNGLFRPSKNKDIDVSFMGLIGSYRDYRKQYIDFLKSSNINYSFSSDETRDSQISNQEYADILSRSKIGLNFSYSVDRHQLKGRVFETMLSGAMLLESANDQIKELFNENTEFVAFTDKEDLLKKINYYLDHDSERENIAYNGRKKVLDCYNGQQYWDAIFSKVGLNA